MDAFTNAIQPNTKLVFGEVLGNPGLEVLDIPSLSEIAHAHHLPLLIDATLCHTLPVSAYQSRC